VWEGERPRSLPLPVEDRNGYEIFVSEEGRSELLQTALLAYDLKPQVDYATQLIDEGAFATAIRTLEVLDAAARAVEVEHPVIRSLIKVIARALAEQGSFDAALQRVAKALALEGRLVGVDRASFASLLPLVAQIFTQAGHAADAEALLRKLLGPDAPEPLPGESAEDPAPYALASIGNSEADEHLQLFLALPKPPPLSDDHRAEALRLLAEAWIIQGRYDEADHLLERASVQADQVLPPAHRGRWRTLTTYGRALYLQRRPEQAEPTLRRALTLAEKHAGPRHPDTGRILAELARVEHRLGRPEAPATAKRALAVLEAAQIADTEKELARADLLPIAGPG
jgi:tetratricopeptide (TPR) repeat protein